MCLFTRLRVDDGRLARFADNNVRATRLVRNHSLYFGRIGVAHQR